MNSDTFRFKIDRIRLPFSKAELIASLKEYAKAHDTETFGMRDYDSWSGRLASSETIRVHFGSWGKALQAAGLRAGRSNKLDLKDMVTAFRDCWREHGSVPSLRHLEDYLRRHNYPFHTKSYGKVFGGLGRLAKLIVQVQEGQLSESELYRPREATRPADRKVSLQTRLAVLKRDGYRCVKCGASPTHNRSICLEVDHIIPVARGGAPTMDNLQTLCWACNQGKKDREN
jgi:hypothetical protein